MSVLTGGVDEITGGNMQKLHKAGVALIAMLALLVTAIPLSDAQEVKPPESEESADSGLGPAVPSAVIPGVETQGNGNNYVLLDNVDVGGPTFNSPSYAPTTVANDASNTDDDGDLVNIGFAFEFYGVPYAQVWINPNGMLSFGAEERSWNNKPLATDTSAPFPTIFGYWDDLKPDGSDGEVLYDTFGAAGNRVFVVKYDDVFLNGAETSGGTFEIRLFEADNAIEVHYFDMVWGNDARDFGTSATVGVRAGDAGSAFLQYSHDLPQINNGLALRMWPAECFGEPATIVGDRGDDILDGTAADDVIYGHHGNDTITGNNGEDIMCGNEGHDTITGGDDKDILRGGPGDDIMAAGLGVDRMWGHDGDDTMSGDGGSDRMYGGNGDDDMQGLSGADRMWGGPGDDIMRGQGGKDTMFGQAGNDTMQGNHQSDRMRGGEGNDRVFGAGGKDKLYGDGGNDELYGGANTDFLDGGPGTDVANGGKGKDNPLVPGTSGCIAETKTSC